MNNLRDRIIPNYEDDGFEYLVLDEKIKLASQYFELSVMCLSAIEMVIADDFNSDYDLLEAFSTLKYSILEQLSQKSYLKDRISLDSDAFDECLRERMASYCVEIRDCIGNPQNKPLTLLYYFYVDPCNILTTAEFGVIEEAEIEDLLNNGTLALEEHNFTMGLVKLCKHIREQLKVSI